MRTILSLFVVLLFVASCGGGDSVEAPPVEPPDVPEVPEMPVTPDPAEPEIPEEPVEPDPVDPVTPEPGPVEPDPVDPVEPEMPVEPTEPAEPEVPVEPEVPDMEELEIPVGEPSRLFPWEECLNTDDLLYFFDSVFQGETRIERFNERPKLSLTEGTTDFQEDIVRRSLEFINYSLPSDYRIGMKNMRVPALSGEPPNSEIYIDFVEKDQWQDMEGVDLEGVLAIARYYSSFDESNPELSERSVHIWIDPQYIQIRFLEDNLGSNRDIRDGNNIGLLSHEILHALGFAGHVSVETHVGFRSAEIFSIMWPTASIVGESGVTGESRISTGANLLFLGILHPADRAGLRYLYEELETGDSPQDIEETGLDMWLTDKGCFSQ